jgi:hypothetical protein
VKRATVVKTLPTDELIARVARDEMEGRMGDAPLQWAGQCHGAAMVVVGAIGEEQAVVRRGYFTGKVDPRSYFAGVPSQHSWVELRNGEIVDPTRFAFTCDPAWPLWHAPVELARDEYDIGGCRMQARSGFPPSAEDTQKELVELEFPENEAAPAHYAQMLQQPLDLHGDDWLQCSVEQIAWLAHLPIREGREEPGMISPFFAPELFEAIIRADLGALIPIDRRDWMLPEHSDGRASF